MHLTNAERLFIWRTRRMLTLEEAARRFDVSIALYKLWEKDSKEQSAPAAHYAKKTTKLKAHEKCRIMRRRHSHIKQQTIADSLGVCRNWIGRMERGEVPCGKLERYWERVAKHRVSTEVPS